MSDKVYGLKDRKKSEETMEIRVKPFQKNIRERQVKRLSVESFQMKQGEV